MTWRPRFCMSGAVPYGGCRRLEPALRLASDARGQDGDPVAGEVGQAGLTPGEDDDDRRQRPLHLQARTPGPVLVGGRELETGRPPLAAEQEVAPDHDVAHQGQRLGLKSVRYPEWPADVLAVDDHVADQRVDPSEGMNRPVELRLEP